MQALLEFLEIDFHEALAAEAFALFILVVAQLAQRQHIIFILRRVRLPLERILALHFM